MHEWLGVVRCMRSNNHTCAYAHSLILPLSLALSLQHKRRGEETPPPDSPEFTSALLNKVRRGRAIYAYCTVGVTRPFTVA